VSGSKLGIYYWVEKIGELAGEGGRPTRTFFIDLRVSLTMSVLGSRGFFEIVIPLSPFSRNYTFFCLFLIA